MAGPVDAPPYGAPPDDTLGQAVEVLLTRVDASVPVPSYAHPGDAGVDLSCTDDVVLGPGERAVVGTGVAIALPPGYAGFVHPRSGLAARAGLSVVNTPGTVDSGYRGEIRVVLLNTDTRASFTVEPGARIAQLVIAPVASPRLVEVDELAASERGARGLGSSAG